tara:strand:+ start:934 stop:1071 length:138 start_codon:yes stop_codon:yes gene_type:complete
MGKIEEGYWDKNYPTHIEVPEGYWTITTTIQKEDKNKYWHSKEDD